MSEKNQQHLQQIAQFWDDQYPKDEPGYCNVKEAYWTEYTHFNLSVLGEAENWKEWFREEQRMWAMDGDPARYDSLLNEEIIEPVVILKRDDTYYVWDGNHRIGASLTKGEYLIKAIVGVPTAQLTPKKIKP